MGSKLTIILIWILLFTAYPTANLLMSCSPSSAYTNDDRAKILDATATSLMYGLIIDLQEGQGRNPPAFIDIFQEICRQYPDDECMASLVNCTVEQLRESIETEEEEQDNGGQTERKVYPSINEDDNYDHRDISISDTEF
ncbi:hypothetical protein N7445_004636 [Penicillium cf. griseofulvum]|nr:hypothetical protein N7445_004636 [Penicillium cf. griseofulvum]